MWGNLADPCGTVCMGRPAALMRTNPTIEAKYDVSRRAERREAEREPRLLAG